MTLEELQTVAVRLASELDRLTIPAQTDAATHQAFRVTRACAVALVDELDRLRRVSKADGQHGSAHACAAAASVFTLSAQ